MALRTPGCRSRREWDAETSLTRISVSDNGIGIDEADIPLDLSVLRLDQGLARDRAGPAGLAEDHPRARRQDPRQLPAGAGLDLRDRAARSEQTL